MAEDNDGAGAPAKGVHGRLTLALREEQASHEARVLKFKNSPSRSVVNPHTHSIKQGFWEHAHAQAERETNERIEAQRRSSLAAFQGVVDAGFVRSQAEYFHRLMLARAPTAHAVRRTYSRAISLLAKGGSTSMKRELFPDSDHTKPAERFVIGATNLYAPNMLIPGPTQSAFLASLAAAAAAHQPYVLVAGICDVAAPPGVTAPPGATAAPGATVVPRSPGAPASPNCHMTAVALLSEAGECFIALTIRPAPGHADDPSLYGRKRVVVFSEDGQTPVLERDLELVFDADAAAWGDADLAETPDSHASRGSAGAGAGDSPNAPWSPSSAPAFSFEDDADEDEDKDEEEGKHAGAAGGVGRGFATACPTLLNESGGIVEFYPDSGEDTEEEEDEEEGGDGAGAEHEECRQGQHGSGQGLGHGWAGAERSVVFVAPVVARCAV